MADQVPSALSSDNKHASIEPVALRVNDAARATGLGRTSIYELIKEGKSSRRAAIGTRRRPATFTVLSHGSATP